jgi:8-oxo-dGTP pyrophosphatase MutT (NUDIX family)
MDSDLLQTTLVVVLDPADGRVLLGRKRKGFGAGRITSYGGKVDPGEDAAACVRREFAEEAGLLLPPEAFRKVGEITFTIDYNGEETFFCHVFRAAVPLPGEPRETDEMTPHWCRPEALPLAEMWADNPYWLPLALRGQPFRAEFLYHPDNRTLRSYHLRLLDGFEAD